MLLFIFFAEFIIGIFTNDQAVAAYGATALRIIGTGYIFYGIGMVMTQALNGAGDTRSPTVINFVCFWLFQIPLALALVKLFDTGVTGIFVAIPVAETAIALLAFWWFKRGKWKTLSV
jgi:Na+-driven multidrug efflux pump